MSLDRPPQPWHEFFLGLDAALGQPVELHCLGGFVVSVLYGMPRPTADVDFISLAPHQEIAAVQSIAGQGSPLHQAHGVYLQYVAIVSVPEDYRDRLVEIFPDVFRHLRIFGLEAHDLALSKLERNAARDREDVKYLARTVPLDLGVLETRYRMELRPYLSNAARHDLTLRLWREAILAD